MISEEGAELSLEPDDINSTPLQVRVLRIVKSRSVQFISCLMVTPSFQDQSSAVISQSPEFQVGIWKDSVVHDKYAPTRAIKTIKDRFARIGYPLVGDRDRVKKAKGIYAAMTTVSWNIGDGVKVVSIEVPQKFKRLLEKEQEFWEHWADREKSVLRTAVNIARREGKSEKQRSGQIDDSDKSEDAIDSGVPVQYVLGKAEFCGRTFNVTKDVMIPRRSSEVLVHTVVNFIMTLAAERRGAKMGALSDLIGNSCEQDESYTLLDLGTGSGCLLLAAMAALRERNVRVRGIGIDISEDTLAVARSNADLLGFSTADITFKVGSFDDLHSSKWDLYDWKVQTVDIAAIVCNPPYSSKKEVSRLSSQVMIHEPHTALFVQSGRPTDNYQRIRDSISQLQVADADRVTEFTCSYLRLAKRHLCVFEVGHGQEKEVKEIFCGKKKSKKDDFRSTTWLLEKTEVDQNGIVRCLGLSLTPTIPADIIRAGADLL